jgi:hypothetical protein
MSQKLTDLLSGLQSAVASVMQQIEVQHTSVLKKYFDIDESGEHITAKTVAIEIPARDKSNSDTEVVNVPLVSLVPIRSLKIEEISIDFEARINSVELKDIKNKFDTKDKKTKNSSENPDDPLEDVNEISNKNVNTEILIEMKKHNFVSPATPVKVSIKFKDSDPPEGIVRVSEHILNQIK